MYLDINGTGCANVPFYIDKVFFVDDYLNIELPNE